MRKVVKDIFGWIMVIVVASLWYLVYVNYYKKEVVFTKLLEERLANPYCFEMPHDYSYEVDNLYIGNTRVIRDEQKSYECYFNLIRQKDGSQDTLKYMAIIYDTYNDKYEVLGIVEK